ncbi:M15 family metallopeptidase [Holophaga foetida]|uniref:M15 family metallopeptidase n=1 Tax=Holophaga foetida TaxID=35839 RepID=UPI0002E53409|nr:M15 family metallopeptidase [Holophaga foetida]
MFWLAVPILLVGLTVAFTLSLSDHHQLNDLSRTGIGPEDKVSIIMGEEKLLAPAPLPPSTFSGTEIPNLETANREWSRLDLNFAKTLLQLFERMQSRQYPLALLEGYRSPERQDMLASKGLHVTHARAFQSKHQYGLAADVAPIRNGKLVISERDPWAAAAYKVLGEEAAALGLVWGGNWAMNDLGHVEWRTKPKAPQQAALTRP